MTLAANCYAVRRLNPFLGVTEVVETAQARALSRDGTSWQLQVLAERPEHTWGSSNRGPTVTQFFQFGVWNPTSGLSRVPINPILDVGAMLQATDQLIERLSCLAPNVPFALKDRYERWLLDTQQQPLALLGTTIHSRLMGDIDDTRWLATLSAGPAFVSPLLESQGVPRVTARSRRHHAERLERQINERAGNPPRVQWFERYLNRGGVPIDAAGVQETACALVETAFPNLGLSLDWPEPEQLQLVWEYLEWNAPRFLTLPHLSDAMRHRLEAAAKGNAMQVEAYYRLYPRVLNPVWIDTARVEARLRNAATADPG